MKHRNPVIPKPFMRLMPFIVASALLAVVFIIFSYAGIFPLFLLILVYVAALIAVLFAAVKVWRKESIHPHLEPYLPVMKTILPMEATELLFLSGTKNPVNIKQFIEKAEDYCLIGVKFVPRGEKYKNQSEEEREEYNKWLQSIFERKLHHALEGIPGFLSFTVEDILYFLIELDINSYDIMLTDAFADDFEMMNNFLATLSENLRKKIIPIQTEIEQSYEVNVQCALSSINIDRCDFAWTSSSLQDLFEYAKMSEIDSFLFSFYQFQRPFSQEEKDSRYHLERKYYNYVLTGNYMDAFDILCQIIEFERAGPLDMRRSIRDRVMYKVDFAILAEGFGTESCYHGVIENDNIHELFIKIGTVDNFREIIDVSKEIFIKLTNQHSLNLNDNATNIVKSAMEYIQTHYSDPNLSIAEICEAVNGKPSNTVLSREFKQQLGLSPSHAITQYRIQMSKQYLMSDKYTVEEIAQKVGYNNRLTFYRAFKKLEGITPGEMRNIMNQQ